MKRTFDTVMTYSLEKNVITEEDIRLLKRRCIDDNFNLWDRYVLKVNAGKKHRKSISIPVTKEQSKKGEDWLMNQIWTEHGHIRKQCAAIKDIVPALMSLMTGYDLVGFKQCIAHDYVNWLPIYRYETKKAFLVYYADFIGPNHLNIIKADLKD